MTPKKSEARLANKLAVEDELVEQMLAIADGESRDSIDPDAIERDRLRIELIKSKLEMLWLR